MWFASVDVLGVLFCACVYANDCRESSAPAKWNIPGGDNRTKRWERRRGEWKKEKERKNKGACWLAQRGGTSAWNTQFSLPAVRGTNGLPDSERVSKWHYCYLQHISAAATQTLVPRSELTVCVCACVCGRNAPLNLVDWFPLCSKTAALWRKAVLNDELIAILRELCSLFFGFVCC